MSFADVGNHEEFELLLQQLREREAQMFRLCLEGYSTSEIASQLGCTRWTVRRVLDRVGQRLAERLE